MTAPALARAPSISVMLLPALFGLIGACGGQSVNDGASGNKAGEKGTTAGAAGKSNSAGGSMGHGGSPGSAGIGVTIGEGGTAESGGTSTSGGGASSAGSAGTAAGTGGAEDRTVCATGPSKGKTCDDYCAAYRAKCAGGTGYGVYQEFSGGGQEEGRQQCLADCKSYSTIYDDDLCCRLGEVAQGEGNPDAVHCDHALFYRGGPFCPQMVRDTTCTTGPGSGKTCDDFCKAYENNCAGIGYLGEGDCLFNCKVQSITDGSLCCRLVEVTQGKPENQACSNAYRGEGGSCPARP